MRSKGYLWTFYFMKCIFAESDFVHTSTKCNLQLWRYITMKIRRCLYLISICRCKMLKIIFFQSTFTGIGSSFLSVETKLKLFSFIQSLYCLCHNERWYRIWLLWKLETTSNKQLLTSSNDIKWYLFMFSRVSQVPFS